MDVISPEKRSKIMAANKSRDTKPELVIRRILHAQGFRFRLHRKDLPGCPDIVLPKHKTIVLVNGCFWHQHAGCKLASKPATHQEYWQIKLARNVERDSKNSAKLVALGWRVVVVWECELQNFSILTQRLLNCLSSR